MKILCSMLLFFHLNYLFAQAPNHLTVYFDFGRSDIRAPAKMKLDSLAASGSYSEISVEGHCDNIGSDDYNNLLSARRTATIRSYLLSKNIIPASIHENHFGESRPVNNNKTSAERALNRRVEIIAVEEKEINITETFIPDSSVDTLSITVPAFHDSTLSEVTTFQEGSQLQLDNMNFVPGMHELIPGAKKTLELLLQVMKEHPALIIRIEGHVCCLPFGDGKDYETGSMNLSVNRAKTVYDYLIENGIEAKRLSFKGFGANKKLVYEHTEEDMQRNRRVEIKILKN